MTPSISLIVMASLYILSGLAHFFSPGLYLKIMPRWVPYPAQVNMLVGVIEILFGAALFISDMQSYAAIGIVLLLVAVFPANVRHFKLARKKGEHVVLTMLRLPLQGVLIYWAYTFI